LWFLPTGILFMDSLLANEFFSDNVNRSFTILDTES